MHSPAHTFYGKQATGYQAGSLESMNLSFLSIADLC